MTKRILPIALAAFALLLTTACSSSRHLAATADPATTHTMQEQYGGALQHAFSYDRLQARVKFTYGGRSLGGRINVEQGKRFRLIVNAPLLGFEMGRIEVDRDSVILVNKVDKTYAVEPLDRLKMDGNKHVDVDMLACLFLGRIYVPGRGEARVADFKRLAWQRQDDGSICGEYGGTNFDLTYTIDSQARLCRTQVTTGEGHTVAWAYDQTEPVAQGLAPTAATVSAEINTRTPRRVAAQVSLSNINPKAEKWEPFAPDGKYRRVDAKDLFNAVKKLMGK